MPRNRSFTEIERSYEINSFNRWCREQEDRDDDLLDTEKDIERFDEYWDPREYPGDRD